MADDISPDPRELTLPDILRMRDEGALFAELEPDRRYILIAYETYPNGTTSNDLVEDAEVAKAIGEKMGIGPPTDANGWGIWEVPS